MAIKLLNHIDSSQHFIKRLVEANHDKLKLWLFPNQLEYKPESSFQPFSINMQGNSLLNLKTN